MFDNLTMEIYYYSVIPVAIIAFISLIFLFLYRKRKQENNAYSYTIKISLIIIISLVLPLIIGYSAWLFNRYLSKQILFDNIGFIIVLGLLIISLIILLTVICKKTYQSFDKNLCN